MPGRFGHPAILFYYRTLHRRDRGTANRTTADRPILYFTYARWWFEGPVNYRHANQHRSILVQAAKPWRWLPWMVIACYHVGCDPCVSVPL